ncbi:hypothetical protein PG997_000319 [Apiospora hydei]|uniref:Heterokaryon incompatibility domain-containing protein n=1 Tax=Apiospora hydei TaxID=1337664 RepID=A0ABR1XAK6_9PEZI
MSMNSRYSVSRAYTHITSAVNGCCFAVKLCSREPNRATRFRHFLDGVENEPIDVNHVTEVIFWMAKIQRKKGIGPQGFGRWTANLLPDMVALPTVEEAVAMAPELRACQYRLWKLIDVCDRKESDLPEIIKALRKLDREHDRQQDDYFHQQSHKVCLQNIHQKCSPTKCDVPHKDTTHPIQAHKMCSQNIHQQCSPNKCQETHKDTTNLNQAHKACPGEKCTKLQFNHELLITAVYQGRDTTWGFEEPGSPLKLLQPSANYLAISHVWADGTGAGSGDFGKVNKCLFDFFCDFARKCECDGIWWDVISVPRESKAGAKALKRMHHNYARAKYTLVHDSHLLEVPWKDDGTPCLEIVLSAWCTRAWTALELKESRHMGFLFKNGQQRGQHDGFVIKDLDRDILAKNPESVFRPHWVATKLISQLRKPVNDVGDLLSILSPRSTSYVRDRTTIAALLVGLPSFDSTAGETDDEEPMEARDALAKMSGKSATLGAIQETLSSDDPKETGSLKWLRLRGKPTDPAPMLPENHQVDSESLIAAVKVLADSSRKKKKAVIVGGTPKLPVTMAIGKNAAKYLVSKDITLEPQQIDKLLEVFSKPSEVSFIGLTMLADMYTDNKKYEKAIHLYKTVNNRYDYIPPDKKNLLDAWRKTNTTVKRADKNDKRDAAMYRLYLNASAELSMFYTRQYMFLEADTTYRGALAEFGTMPSHNEAFRIGWAQRATQTFRKKSSRDKDAAGCYERALKRFNALFHQKHPIIQMTQLHLGVNYTLQEKSKEAEHVLRHAELGVEQDRGGVPEGDHAFLGLVKYHLGNVYLKDHKLEEAKTKLEEAMAKL